MNKKGIGSRTLVYMILSVIFLILIIITISTRPIPMWESVKDFSCRMSFGVILCDDEDDNGSSNDGGAGDGPGGIIVPGG